MFRNQDLSTRYVHKLLNQQQSDAFKRYHSGAVILKPVHTMDNMEKMRLLMAMYDLFIEQTPFYRIQDIISGEREYVHICLYVYMYTHNLNLYFICLSILNAMSLHLYLQYQYLMVPSISLPSPSVYNHLPCRDALFCVGTGSPHPTRCPGLNACFP